MRMSISNILKVVNLWLGSKGEFVTFGCVLCIINFVHLTIFKNTFEFHGFIRVSKPGFTDL